MLKYSIISINAFLVYTKLLLQLIFPATKSVIFSNIRLMNIWTICCDKNANIAYDAVRMIQKSNFYCSVSILSLYVIFMMHIQQGVLLWTPRSLFARQLYALALVKELGPCIHVWSVSESNVCMCIGVTLSSTST